MTHIGFTGTQHGMTPQQQAVVDWLLVTSRDTPAYFHHGDCVGADAEAHTIALRHTYAVVIHPPIHTAKRAHCVGAYLVLPPADYIVRNHDIVDECNLLIATPAQSDEQIRSGTWATIRYAHRKRRRTVIVHPDGTMHPYKPRSGVG